MLISVEMNIHFWKVLNIFLRGCVAKADSCGTKSPNCIVATILVATGIVAFHYDISIAHI